MKNRSSNAAPAPDLIRIIERACVERDPSVLIRHMTADTVWRDNDAVFVGRDEIWIALTEKWARALHCALQQDVESIDERAICIRFESEWQHAVHGRWYRTNGQFRISLDDEQRITTVETRHTDMPISVSSRRQRISMPAVP
ncbi:MAG: DUF1348 family protein [Woeseiaceae bacterium]|nr:DUF1348 family protein [Woeseiaceae bacterium]